MTKRGKDIIKYLEKLTPEDDEAYDKLTDEEKKEFIKNLAESFKNKKC